MATKISGITRRQKIRAVEHKRDTLILKHDNVKADLARTRAELKRIRAQR